ncbi:MAG TPA: TraB/GumN family protein, partial [Phenylobacterium sp.]
MAWRKVAAVAAGVSIGLGLAGPAAAAPAMWVVRDADSEIFLFGTMHALKPGLDWRTPAYDAAYAKAKAVWFEAEADPIDPAQIRDLIARYGVDPDQPLSRKLSARQLAELRAVLAEGTLTLAQI